MSRPSEIEPIGEDVVLVRHPDGAEVCAEDIRRNLELIMDLYPGRFLLLVDHVNSYSMTADALGVLKEMRYFRAWASVAPDPRVAETLRRTFRVLRFSVPFEIFDSYSDALAFLRCRPVPQASSQ